MFIYAQATPNAYRQINEQLHTFFLYAIIIFGVGVREISIDMNRYLPLWKRLLDEQALTKLHLVRGYSIPMFIGVYYSKGILNNDDLQDSRCIKKVFDKIVNSIGQSKLIIEHCGDLDEFQDFDEQIGNNTIVLIIQRLQEDDKLTGRRSYKDKIFFPKQWSDYNGDLILKLWEMYGDQIKQHNFSRGTDDYIWRPFQNNVLSNGKMVDEKSTIAEL